MDFTNSQKSIIILAIVALVTIFILWPDSSEQPSKTKHAEAQLQEVESRGPARRFHLTHVDDDTMANRLRPSEQKHLDSTKIAPGQTTLIAKDDEQYLAILERLAELGIRPRGTLEALRSINVILDDATLDRLKNEFDDIAAAQDNIVWIPEDSIEPWSGRLGPGFGNRLLDWLGIDAAKEKRGEGVTVAVLDTAISKSVVNQNADIKQIDLFNYSENAGETGHIRLTDYGPVGYGKAGSFEGYCSGGGIRQLLDNVAGVLDNLPADENKRAEVTEILEDMVEAIIRSTNHLEGELGHRLGGELMID